MSAQWVKGLVFILVALLLIAAGVTFILLGVGD